MLVFYAMISLSLKNKNKTKTKQKPNTELQPFIKQIWKGTACRIDFNGMEDIIMKIKL